MFVHGSPVGSVVGGNATHSALRRDWKKHLWSNVSIDPLHHVLEPIMVSTVNAVQPAPARRARPAEQISLSSQDQAPILRGLIFPSGDGDDRTCRPTSPFANECCCSSNFTRWPRWQHKTHGWCGNEGTLIFLMVAWAIVSMASQVWRRVYPCQLSFRAQMHWAKQRPGRIRPGAHGML